MTSDDSRQRVSGTEAALVPESGQTQAFGGGGRLRFALSLPAPAVTSPPRCACCGAPGLHKISLRGAAHSFLVAYCEPCAVHVARNATEQLAARLGSAIVGLAACFALPVFLPWWSKALCGLVAVAMASLPFARAIFPARLRAPHTAVGAAVFSNRGAEIVCTNEGYARELAERAGASVNEFTPPRALPVAELTWLALLGLLLTPLSHAYQHPPVRVLNLGDEAFELYVEGVRIERVQPSSGESPFAGLEVAVPAGRRRFERYDAEHQLLDMAVVEVRAGEHHLYAPASPDVCFWLETRSYGRGAHKPAYEPLTDPERFWVIPDDVHGWFLPAAEGTSDTRATGGSVRVLRQAPCNDAPFEH